MKKIWIVGSLGHMGQALIRLLDMMEYELYETDKDELDITDEHAVSLFMHRNRPDVVINCAGYHPSAGAAQSETDMAYKVNAVGARNLAQSAESIQAKLIQISTDDVFSSASDTPYNEFDDVNPVGLFAKSKYAGEKFVIQLMTRYVIIRSSWIYGIGKDFLNEVLEAAADSQVSTMELLNNDRAVPTSAAELARVVKFFIDNDHYGIYHAVCSGGSCTRLEFAEEILRLAGKEDRLTVTVKDGIPDAASHRHRRTHWLERDTGFLHERNRRAGIVEKHKKEKKKLGLSTKIFIALLTGAVCGVLIHYYMPEGYFRDTILINGILYVLGNGFIRLMQMLVVPLVFCSLVCGAMAIGDTKTLGTVGVKTILFYLCTTALAICVALGIASLINPGVGLNIALPEDATEVATTQVDFAETLLNIIPKNIFTSLSAGDMLPIIFFALFVGILLAAMGNRVSTVANFFSQFNDIMMEMTIAVMKAAPVGVFCLIAKTFAGIGFDAFVPMLKYMGSVILALAVQCFVVYQVMLFVFTRLNPFKFIKKFFPVMTFAFSTSTSNATIPLSIDTLYKKIGVSKQISSFTIPLGATINMDGTSIMQGVAVVFAAQAFGIHLTPMDYVTVIGTATLASVGTAGVPSVGLVTLTMVFNSVGLPVEAIGLIMGIDRILDMTRTAVNITGDAVCTTIVAHQNGALDKKVFNETE